MASAALIAFVMPHCGLSQQPLTTLSPEDIARLASQKSSLAIMMKSDLRADAAEATRKSNRQQAILDLRTKVQDYRICRQSQIVAAQALELHFGLATIAALEPIQNEIDTLLQLTQERQNRAIERGVSILDPTAIDRLVTTANDSKLQSLSKTTQLRSQLSLLVDPSIACYYIPEPMSTPDLGAQLDHCQMVEMAMHQRCDLVGLVYLRSQLNEQTLEVARWMSDLLSGSVSFSPLKCNRIFSLIGIVLPKEKMGRDEELCVRLAMLDQAIAILREKIASEVEIAIDKQLTAAKRYANSLLQIEHWQTRVAQLRAYGDQVKAQPAEELESAMQLLQVRSELVQRQGEWHQAIVELALAVGCIP